MKINKKYSLSNGRQIWRILISTTGRLIVEERDLDKKQAFFNCLNLYTGEDVFRDLKMEEEYWIGIETVYKDIIYFHKFSKPDMPGHKEIIAFDIPAQRVLWHNDQYAFLFVHEDKVYAYRQKFSDRVFFTYDYLTGEFIEELGNKAAEVNRIRESLNHPDNYAGYVFPSPFRNEGTGNASADVLIKKVSGDGLIDGSAEYALYKDLVLFNFYRRPFDNSLVNRFVAADMNSGDILMDEVLNAGANSVVPDNFFIKDNMLLLIKEKKELIVYSLD